MAAAMLLSTLLLTLPVVADYDLGTGPFVLIPSQPDNGANYLGTGTDNFTAVGPLSSLTSAQAVYLQVMSADNGPNAYSMYLQDADGNANYFTFENEDSGPDNFHVQSDGIYAWQVWTLDVVDGDFGVQLHSNYMDGYLSVDQGTNTNGFYTPVLEKNGDTGANPGEIWYFYNLIDTFTSTVDTVTQTVTTTQTVAPDASTTTMTTTISSCSAAKRDLTKRQDSNPNPGSVSDTYYLTLATTTATITTTETTTISSDVPVVTDLITTTLCPTGSVPANGVSAGADVSLPAGSASGIANVIGPTTPPASSNANNDEGGLSGGAIAGIVVGVIAGVVLVVAGVVAVFFLKRRKRMQREDMVREIATVPAGEMSHR